MVLFQFVDVGFVDRTVAGNVYEEKEKEEYGVQDYNSEEEEEEQEEREDKDDANVGDIIILGFI